MRNVNQSLKDKLKLNIQTDNKMSIQVSRAKTSVIDSTYWTVETIREKVGLGDISIAPRRLKSSGRPDRLYEIHVDNGQVSTALREYPDYQKDGWQHQFDLGSGSSVAIAFDGEWELYRKKWRMRTIGEPWIFWVDDAGKLMGQWWDDVSTLIELSTDVVKVKAIRAWKNVNILENDQGIVVLYYKTDGKVYYRNYCKQANGTTTWEVERQVTDFTGTAVNINLFISNDYRLGILIEDSSHNVTMIVTDRNWAGMALGRETVTASSDIELDFIEVNYIDGNEDEIVTIGVQNLSFNMLFGQTLNSLIALENVPITRLNDDLVEYQDWGFKIKCILEYPTRTFPAATVTDVSSGLSLGVSSIDQVSDTEFYINIDQSAHEFGFNGAEGTVSVSMDLMKNEAGYFYDQIVQEFTPTNLIEPIVPIPEIVGAWNE